MIKKKISTVLAALLFVCMGTAGALENIVTHYYAEGTEYVYSLYGYLSPDCTASLSNAASKNVIKENIKSEAGGLQNNSTKEYWEYTPEVIADKITAPVTEDSPILLVSYLSGIEMSKVLGNNTVTYRNSNNSRLKLILTKTPCISFQIRPLVGSPDITKEGSKTYYSMTIIVENGWADLKSGNISIKETNSGTVVYEDTIEKDRKNKRIKVKWGGNYNFHGKNTFKINLKNSSTDRDKPEWTGALERTYIHDDTPRTDPDEEARRQQEKKEREAAILAEKVANTTFSITANRVSGKRFTVDTKISSDVITSHDNFIVFVSKNSGEEQELKNDNIQHWYGGTNTYLYIEVDGPATYTVYIRRRQDNSIAGSATFTLKAEDFIRYKLLDTYYFIDRYDNYAARFKIQQEGDWVQPNMSTWKAYESFYGLNPIQSSVRLLSADKANKTLVIEFTPNTKKFSNNYYQPILEVAPSQYGELVSAGSSVDNGYFRETGFFFFQSKFLDIKTKEVPVIEQTSSNRLVKETASSKSPVAKQKKPQTRTVFDHFEIAVKANVNRYEIDKNYVKITNNKNNPVPIVLDSVESEEFGNKAVIKLKFGKTLGEKPKFGSGTKPIGFTITIEDLNKDPLRHQTLASAYFEIDIKTLESLLDTGTGLNISQLPQIKLQ